MSVPHGQGIQPWIGVRRGRPGCLRQAAPEQVIAGAPRVLRAHLTHLMKTNSHTLSLQVKGTTATLFLD